MSPSKSLRAYTLVEILIVVVLLGILAAVVIPRFVDATDDTRAANLRANLRTIRMQLELYRLEHNNTYPGNMGSSSFRRSLTGGYVIFWGQLTRYTNADGIISGSPAEGYPYGPYLNGEAENPFTGSNHVEIVQEAGKQFEPPSQLQTDRAWWFNYATGEFRAYLPDSCVDSYGFRLNQY